MPAGTPYGRVLLSLPPVCHDSPAYTGLQNCYVVTKAVAALAQSPAERSFAACLKAHGFVFTPGSLANGGILIPSREYDAARQCEDA